VRILDPKCVAKTFPDYFEALFALAHGRHRRGAGDHHRRPHGIGQGHAGRSPGAAAGLALAGFGRRSTAPPRWRRSGRRGAGRRAGLARWPRRWTCASTAPQPVLLRGTDVATSCAPKTPALASRVSAWPGRAQALHGLQLAFRRAPGLVADGRDMGTVVFPGAPLKVFLTASAAERAERRHKQLISKGIPASIADLRADLEARDARDQSRVAPLKPAEDALLLDNSELGIENRSTQVLGWWQQRSPLDQG
jgi:3-phosphoshikimate 1-carboxyvinyltransferase